MMFLVIADQRNSMPGSRRERLIHRYPFGGYQTPLAALYGLRRGLTSMALPYECGDSRDELPVTDGS